MGQTLRFARFSLAIPWLAVGNWLIGIADSAQALTPWGWAGVVFFEVVLMAAGAYVLRRTVVRTSVSASAGVSRPRPGLVTMAAVAGVVLATLLGEVIQHAGVDVLLRAFAVAVIGVPLTFA